MKLGALLMLITPPDLEGRCDAMTLIPVSYVVDAVFTIVCCALPDTIWNCKDWVLWSVGCTLSFSTLAIFVAISIDRGLCEASSTNVMFSKYNIDVVFFGTLGALAFYCAIFVLLFIAQCRYVPRSDDADSTLLHQNL
jgi:hypothetical protein